MRLAPVMLALLLALSPGAVAIQASAPTAPTASSVDQPDTVRGPVNENTTAVLTLGTEPDRTAFDSPSASLGSSLAMDHEEFRSELSTKKFDRQLQDADSTETEKRILNRYRFDIENRIISLKAEERQASQAFSNGEISPSQYVRTLGRITAEAAEVKRAINAMADEAESVPKFSLDNEATSLEAKLVSLEGPIRDRIESALKGETQPTRIYVATTDSGVVLSTIIGDTYVREVYRDDNRDPSANGQMTLEEGENSVIKPQYSWVVSNRKGTSNWAYNSIHVLRFMYHHPHGNLTAYVDTGTEQVFREIQYKTLTGQQSLQPGPGVQNTTSNAFGSENVTLTVNRTYAGGPLRVELTNETGAPLDGQITVADESIGRTGSDGALWMLSPDEQFRVNATYEETTVDLAVTPIELERNSSEG